ncbi:MAG: ribosomal protein S18-alanine N-acetyltransferase [Psychrilyobacter sp.]|nr:ribosomal protein S18-alanine N-acetyltransferase [Psychrilyobacter sp.]
MKYEIREIEELELLDLYEIEKNSFLNNYNLSTLSSMYTNSRYKFLGIYNRKKMIGYIIILDSIDIYELIKIAISSNYRGKKLGEQLLKYSLEILDKNLILEVRENNNTAIKFYEKLGFKKINIRKGYYEDTGEDGMVYLFSREE